VELGKRPKHIQVKMRLRGQGDIAMAKGVLTLLGSRSHRVAWKALAVSTGHWLRICPGTGGTARGGRRYSSDSPLLLNHSVIPFQWNAMDYGIGASPHSTLTRANDCWRALMSGVHSIIMTAFPAVPEYIVGRMLPIGPTQLRAMSLAGQATS